MTVYIEDYGWGQVISYADADHVIVRLDSDPWFPIMVDATEIQQRQKILKKVLTAPQKRAIIQIQGKERGGTEEGVPQAHG